VVPLFREQIASGGPVTVTDPEIERFFMTIPEACQLILQASIVGRGGDILVLDMGQPVKIKDLAEQMIRLSGKQPGIDIEVRYIGLRPGEKLYEELFHESESLSETSHPKVLRFRHRQQDSDEIVDQLQNLQQGLDQGDAGVLFESLRKLVPESTIRRV
jgi:FlaA1/EpsC-like NDP-sugar epimerase